MRYPNMPGSFHHRLPVIVSVVIAGILVSGAATGPWVLLVLANRRFFPEAPWGSVVMAAYLWMYWRYLQGHGWPRSTSEWRRTCLRARGLSASVWGMSLFAGVIGLGALVAFQRLLARLVPLAPEQQASDFATTHHFAVVISLIMASIVAGVAEEAGFRGYMQKPIEQRHGPVVAILISGLVFGFAHFTHPQVGFFHLPFYLGASAVYGGLAYLTGSILPGLVLHAAGDTLEFLMLLAGDQSVVPTPSTAPLVWESGPDLYFWARCVWVAAWIIGAVAAYRALAREVRSQPVSV